MYQTILILHIAGALALFGVIIVSVTAIVKSHLAYLKNLAKAIGFGSSFQVVTGSMLAFNSESTATIWSFCSKMSIYFLMVIAIELALFYKIKNKQNFPKIVIINTSALSIASIILVIVLAF